MPNYFSPEGEYDISDYRSPDDTRRNDEAQLALNGQFDTEVHVALLRHLMFIVLHDAFLSRYDTISK